MNSSLVKLNPFASTTSDNSLENMVIMVLAVRCGQEGVQEFVSSLGN